MWVYVLVGRARLILGQVILGGTLDADDWYPHPRAETGRAILGRALALMPALVRGGQTAPEVIEHGCGLRPARRGGIRLEGGTVTAAGRTVPVVYNYG